MDFKDSHTLGGAFLFAYVDVTLDMSGTRPPATPKGQISTQISTAEQPWLAASVVERERLTSLLSVCFLSVSFFRGDELQENGVGPQERICHPLAFFRVLWSTHLHGQCQWKRLHLLLHGTETG